MAAARNNNAANHRVFYDTLTELDDDAKQLIKHNFDPSMASKSIIVTIFSNQIPIEELKPPAGERPVIIITAGSPGVGKSTIAKEQFRKFGVDPNKVYTVSMDTLLEHNRLFRTETKQLYNKWHAIKGEFSNSNYATFSGISTAAYASKQANLKIPEKILNINSKYADKLSNAEFVATFQKFKVSSPKASPKKSRPTRKKVQSPVSSPIGSPLRTLSPPLRSSPKSPPNSPSKNTTLRRSSRIAAKPKKGGAIEHDLDNIREIGFEFGVANGLNILYDCTLSKTGKRMSSIMDVLEKYADAGPKYEIKVLLIEADDDINEAAQIIQKRIKGRHHQMIRNGFLRALTLSIPAIKSMIKQNKEGFNVAQETYSEKIVNPPYEPSDFYFEEIMNPQR